MTLRIDIGGLPSGRLRFAASPLAELTAMLHVLAEPAHHPQLAGWAEDVWAGLRPELAERLTEAEFLWRSSRADFLVPARPRPTLAEELDDVDRIDDETYVTAALITTCGSNRVHFASPSPLADATARERALDLAQARGALQEAFAERLLADPAVVRTRVRHTLEQCAEAFFDAAWTGVAVQLATDLRLKNDLLKRQGIGAALIGLRRSHPGTGRQLHHRGQTAGQGDRRPQQRGHLHPQRLRQPAPGGGPRARVAAGGAVPRGRAESITARIAGNSHATAGGTRASGTAAAAAHPGPRPAHHR